MEDFVFHVAHVERFLENNLGLVKDPKDVLRRVKEGADKDGLVMSGWLENLIGPKGTAMLGELVGSNPEYMKLSSRVVRSA